MNGTINWFWLVKIFSSIDKNFKERGLFLEQLLVRNITLPASVKLTIESKINAEQDLFNFYKQNDFFPDENESLESIKKLNQSLAAQNFNVFDSNKIS